MGVSTDGVICLGIPFEERCKFPWHNKEYGGSGQDALEAWWEGRSEGQELPVEMVNYCSDEYPMYVLAVRGTVDQRGAAALLKDFGHLLQSFVRRTIRFSDHHANESFTVDRLTGPGFRYL